MKEDEWKTAFQTKYSHYKYHIMSFGLANSTVSFQSYIQNRLTEKLDVFCIVYLDDIII